MKLWIPILLLAVFVNVCWADVPEEHAIDLREGLDAYLLYAKENSPELRSHFERYRAATLRVPGGAKLPNPTISYGFYLRNVETRVGPQRHRLSVKQSFPWPTKITRSKETVDVQARAFLRIYEANALALEQRVIEAYYSLWFTRKVVELKNEQVLLLTSLAETVRSRVRTGSVTLADQQQVDLALVKMEDQIDRLKREEAVWTARLRATIGAPLGMSIPTTEVDDRTYLLAEATTELYAALTEHPLNRSYEDLGLAKDLSAESERADRFPSFTVGFDWIETGPSNMPDVPDSGKDAIILSAGASIPLWQGDHGSDVEALRAEAAVARAEGQAALTKLRERLEVELANLHDTVRRISLSQNTLLPQAQTTLESVLGAYTVNRTSVTAALSSISALLEIEISLLRAKVEHAITWARIQNIVGRTVERKDAVATHD